METFRKEVCCILYNATEYFLIMLQKKLAIVHDGRNTCLCFLLSNSLWYFSLYSVILYLKSLVIPALHFRTAMLNVRRLFWKADDSFNYFLHAAAYPSNMNVSVQCSFKFFRINIGWLFITVDVMKQDRKTSSVGLMQYVKHWANNKGWSVYKKSLKLKKGTQ